MDINRDKQEEEGESRELRENNAKNDNTNVKRVNDVENDGIVYSDDNAYHYNNAEIGKTIISDKYPNTIDSFWFALAPGTIAKPFDFVTVEQSFRSSSSMLAAGATPTITRTGRPHSYSTKTIGMIQDLQAVMPTDNHHHYLFQSSNKIESVPRSDENNNNNLDNNTSTSCDLDHNIVYQNGITVARVAVMANYDFYTDGKLSNIPAGMPVGLGKSVRFSNAEEVMFALGIPEMAYPIPAGIIEMSNGLRVPVFLDISYIAGPDTVHVNASGISGNAKTSYLLFLLQSLYQKLREYAEEYAIIIFNTKCGSLLHIDKDGGQSFKKNNDKESFDILNLDIAPFDNVTYFLPRGRDGRPNSTYVPMNSKTYSYELEDVYDRLDLLFSEIYDPHYYNLSSIVNYIYEFWPIGKTTKTTTNTTPTISNSLPIREYMREKKQEIASDGQILKTWTDLFNFKDYPEEIITNKSSLLQFQGYIQRFRRSSLFIDKKVTSTYLGKEIKQIRTGDVFVVDIAMLSSLEEQAFVIGDAMKSIDEIYSATEMSNEALTIGSGENEDNKNNNNFNIANNNGNVKTSKKPKYFLIFIDEINRFLPNTMTFGRRNTVAEQIMKTIIAGRSRHTILFSAQQFKSAVDYSLHENTGLHITAKVGLSELSSMPYNIIDQSTKMNIVRLNKGELVMVHSAFRHPIKITFPKASIERK
jgi:hypothetical protein